MPRSFIPSSIHGDGRFLLRRRDFEPAYLRTRAAGRLQEKVDAALSHLGPSCRVCPRLCKGVDRLSDQFGVCKVGRHARVASAFPHFGEEDVLRGWLGSGTIFFALCNLRCVFCQNHDISQSPVGEAMDAKKLARLMIRMQKQGCHNINFVTPEHVAPQIVEALPLAIDMGLSLPLVYNTSSYDSLDTLEVLDGLVDIYMPDFKLWDAAANREYLGAVNYAEVARSVISEMHRQVGELKCDEDGLAIRGVLVRHLVMPDHVNDTRHIVRWLADLSRDTYLNMMDQYHPDGKVLSNPRFDSINRGIRLNEMVEAVAAARDAGLWRLDERWRHAAHRRSLPMLRQR